MLGYLINTEQTTMILTLKLYFPYSSKPEIETMPSFEEAKKRVLW